MCDGVCENNANFAFLKVNVLQHFVSNTSNAPILGCSFRIVPKPVHVNISWERKPVLLTTYSMTT